MRFLLEPSLTPGIKTHRPQPHFLAEFERHPEPAFDALVTGASGFIGRQLALRLIQQGQRVRVYSRRPSAVADLQHLGAQVVIGDLDDCATLAAAVDDVATVYHLAGLTSALDEDDLMRVNGEGACHLARACATREDPPVLVHVSSLAAAGPTSRDSIRTEKEIPAPVSNYGRSKLAGEQAVAAWAGDFPITIIRPGIVYGPQNKEMLPIFHTLLRAFMHPVAGWQTPPLSLIYIDDLVDMIIRASELGTRLPARANVEEQLISGRGVYFATGPEHPDYAELGYLLRPMLGRKFAPVVHLPKSIVWTAAQVHEWACRLRGHSDTFNRDKIREATVPSWACSGELAQRDLGFKPPKSLADRLATTIDWYREQRWI